MTRASGPSDSFGPLPTVREGSPRKAEPRGLLVFLCIKGEQLGSTVEPRFGDRRDLHSNSASNKELIFSSVYSVGWANQRNAGGAGDSLGEQGRCQNHPRRAAH